MNRYVHVYLKRSEGVPQLKDFLRRPSYSVYSASAGSSPGLSPSAAFTLSEGLPVFPGLKPNAAAQPTSIYARYLKNLFFMILIL